MDEEIALEQLGLTRIEAEVYIALLKIGSTTTGPLVKASELHRATVYDVLKRLMEKGLVNYIIKEKTKYFIPASPNRIKDYLHEKEKDIEAKEKELDKELPLLLKVYNSKLNKNNSFLFKGLKGIQVAIFQALESLNKDDEVLAMGLVSRKDEKYNILWEKWHNERVSKKVKCRAIFSEKGEYYNILKKMKLMDIKIIEELTLSPIDIIGDKVLIFTYGEEPSCLYIENKEIAESFNSFFETMWKIAGK